MAAYYKYNPSFEELLSGRLDYAILVCDQCFVAWSKTGEGPTRPDFLAAAADLRDMLVAGGHEFNVEGNRRYIFTTPTAAIAAIEHASPAPLEGAIAGLAALWREFLWRDRSELESVRAARLARTNAADAATP
jgi:hypothetical protein